MKRIKLLGAAAVLSALALAQPLMAQTETGPVVANAFITFGGLDWAWASPCMLGAAADETRSQPACDGSTFVLADGFRFATAEEWAARPAASDFLDPHGNFLDVVAGVVMRCASAWFDVNPAFLHCDYDDGAAGYVTSGLGNGGTVSGDEFDGGAETWLVRDATVGVTPEPASMALLATGLISMAAAARRKKQRTTS